MDRAAERARRCRGRARPVRRVSSSLVAAASAVVSSPPVLASSAARNPRSVGSIERQSKSEHGRPGGPCLDAERLDQRRLADAGDPMDEHDERAALAEQPAKDVHLVVAPDQPCRLLVDQLADGLGHDVDFALCVNQAAIAIEARVTWLGPSRIPNDRRGDVRESRVGRERLEEVASGEGVHRLPVDPRVHAAICVRRFVGQPDLRDQPGHPGEFGGEPLTGASVVGVAEALEVEVDDLDDHGIRRLPSSFQRGAVSPLARHSPGHQA